MATLSVIVPNYNHARYLPISLGAILAQSREPDEIIVIDDASTDNSLSVIDEFVHCSNTIRVIRNSTNQGVMANSRMAIDVARGEYIYWAAADDKVLPGFFELSMEQLRRHPDAALCFSDPAILRDDGEIVPNRMRLSKLPTLFDRAALVRKRTRKSFNIAHHTAPVKTSIVRNLGGFLPELRWHCDWFMMWVMAFRHGACYIPRPLAAIRTTNESYSAIANRTCDDELAVHRSMLQLLDSPAYADVADAFRESQVFSTCGFKMWRVMGENRRWARYQSRGLLAQMVTNECWRVLGYRTPSPLRRAYRRASSLRERWFAG